MVKNKIIEIVRKEVDPSIRFEILEKFYHSVENENDVLFIIDVLNNDNDPCVRHEAAAQLFRIAEKKPDLLINLKQVIINSLLDKAYHDISTVVRHESIEALGYIVDKNSLKYLHKLRMDDNIDISSTANIAYKTAKRRLVLKLKASEITDNIIATWGK